MEAAKDKTTTRMEDNTKKSAQGSNGRSSRASKRGQPSVIAVQRRGQPLNETAREKAPSKVVHERGETDLLEGLSAQLALEERETNFASPENARRVVSTISAALSHPDEALRRRASVLLSTWLTKGESEFIDAINTPFLFELTLDVSKTKSNIRVIREKVVKAFITRLKAARQPIEWLRWLRSSLARGEMQPIDVRPVFEPLLQAILSLVGKTRHAVSVAPRSASFKKMSELWGTHSATSVEVCATLMRSPDGLGALCLALPDVAKKVMGAQALSSPGAFAVRVANGVMFGVSSDNDNSDWFHETPFSSNDTVRLSFAEAQAWMEVCAFAVRSVSTRNKTAVGVASKLTRILQFVFKEYTEAFIKEFPSVQSRRASSEEATSSLLEALEALRGYGDLATGAELVLSLRNQPFLVDSSSAIRIALHGVCTALAEVGVQLVVEQVVRYGSLLATHSWELAEGDAVEAMVKADLEWIAETPLTKLFLDGRYMLRIVQACVWPAFCPLIADKCLTIARQFAKLSAADPTSASSSIGSTWSKVQSVLSERFARIVDFSVTSTAAFVPASANASMVWAEARRVFSRLSRHQQLIPTFARKEYGFPSPPEMTRLMRAKRFADAVLGILALGENDASIDEWRVDCAQVFWECLLESDSSSIPIHEFLSLVVVSGEDAVPQQNMADLSSSKNEHDFVSWLWVWACRALTFTTLRSRFGSPKDTFQQFETAMEQRRNMVLKNKRDEDVVTSATITAMVLDLLWCLHREVLVFAPVHPEQRVASFFAKNSETCQSWLIRLTSLSLRLEERASFLRGPLSIFYNLYYEDLPDKPAPWTALMLESFAKRGNAACIRAVGVYSSSEAFATASARSWRAAFELFAEGAYIRAADEFEHSVLALSEEVEEAKQVTDAERWRVRTARRFASESRSRLGQWTLAKEAFSLGSGLVKHEEDATYREDALRFLTAIEALDQGGKEAIYAEDSRGRVEESALEAMRTSPLVAFAKWCAEPSSTSLSRVVKTACSVAQVGGWAEVEELRRFTTGRVVGGNVGGSSTQHQRQVMSSSSDELWAVTEVARRQFKLKPAVGQTMHMCMSALEAGDFKTATILTQKIAGDLNDNNNQSSSVATSELLVVRLARMWMEATGKGFVGDTNGMVDALLSSQGPSSITRRFVELKTPDAILPSALRSDNGGIDQLLEELSQSSTSPAVLGEYLFTLAGMVREEPSRSQTAAQIHYRCMQLSADSPIADRALLLYLEETDVVGDPTAATGSHPFTSGDVGDTEAARTTSAEGKRREELGDLPLAVLRRNLIHITARAKDASMALALEKVAKEDPRAIVWELVASAEDESSVAMDLAKRAIAEGTSLLTETQSLKAALVEASRTLDEDWEDLFEELQKKPWLDRALDLSDRKAAEVILDRARKLWEETTTGFTSQSVYHRRFVESDAGRAIARWLSVAAPSSSSKEFHSARIALGNWISSQGTTRTFGELAEGNSGAAVFTVVPGQADGSFAIEEHVDVLRTKTRPRKIGFKMISPGASSSVGPPYQQQLQNRQPMSGFRWGTKRLQTKHFLLKSAEDLRLDQRLVQLWAMLSPSGMEDRIRSYLVIPLSRRVGLVEWVDRSVPLFHAYREWKEMRTSSSSSSSSSSSAAASALINNESNKLLDNPHLNLEVEKGERSEVTDQFQRALLRTETKNDRLTAYREVASSVDPRLLRRFIWTTSRDAESFWNRTMNFATSAGVTSALGWAVGLGDRHLDNVLLEVDTGRVVHVDLNVCFDKGLRLRVPETVPFRLTGIMVGAMPLASSSRRQTLERGPFGSAMEATVRELQLKKEETMAFLSAFVFDPVRPQSASSRIGLLNMEQAEFQALKELFMHDAGQWLQDPIVCEARVLVEEKDLFSFGGLEADHSTKAKGEVDDDRDEDDDNDVEVDEDDDDNNQGEQQNEENPRLTMERAKAIAHRALADCSRQKERAVTAFNAVQNSERVLKREPILMSSALSSDPQLEFLLPEAMRKAQSNLAKAESLCAQVGAQSLGRIVSVLKRFTSLSKLQLPCAIWTDRLHEINRRVSSGLNTSDSSSAVVAAVPSRLDVNRDDLQSIEGFRAVAQSIVDTVGDTSFIVGTASAASDPRVMTAVHKLERAQKKVQDFIALTDAVLLLVQMSGDDCAQAQKAAKGLRKALGRGRGPSAQPLMRESCARAPDCGDFLSVCLQLRLGRDRLAALSRYQELAGTPGGLKPKHLGLACRLLEESMRVTSAMTGEENSLFIAQGEQVKAELQAKQANARVRMRLEDPLGAESPSKLVSQLIEQATSEKNLSEMWIGWMPFI